MGYMHIENLYKNQNVLMFKEVYALEKIHGTSAHLTYKSIPSGDKTAEGLWFYSGGEKYENFVKLFDKEKLMLDFRAMGHFEVNVYGEAYGGKCQGMSATYGKDLKFVVFEVQIGDCWLDVPNAEDVAKKLGLEFVAYEKVPATVEALDAERDRPSRQAVRNGMGDNHKAEGIVIKPLMELHRSNGERIIAKHKRADFSERKSKADTMVGSTQLQILSDAQAIATEWVTDMRLHHVMDTLKAGLQRELQMSDTPKVIALMAEDIGREANGEIIPSKEVGRAIGSATVRLFHAFLKKDIQ